MKCRYSWARLEAKLGVPRCEMGSISRNVEFDFVVCLQHLARFCVTRNLDYVDKLFL